MREGLGLGCVEMGKGMEVINGVGVLFKGVKGDEEDGDDGGRMRVERMIKEIELMKELKVNGVGSWD